MNETVLLVGYCALILLASLAGGWIPFLIKLTHTRMQIAISIVAGFMLGIALLHMLPHSLMAAGIDDGHGHGAPAEGAAVSVTAIVGWMMAGLLVMFFIERFFCFHHHDAPEIEAEAVAAGASDDPQVHDHACTHEHDHSHDQHKLSWSGAAVGLTVHSIIAGIALAASVAAEFDPGAHEGHDHAAGDGGTVTLAGLAVFLVIFLHKPFDSLTIGTLMTVGKARSGFKHMINALYALAVPLGVALFYLGLASSDVEAAAFTGYALAFSAGTFLCIALSDLLPELQFHQHDRFKLSGALLAGIALAWVISIYEAQLHGHDEHSTHDEQSHIDHDHGDHNDDEHDGHDHDEHDLDDGEDGEDARDHDGEHDHAGHDHSAHE